MKRFKETTALALTLGMLFTSVPYAALADSASAVSQTLTQTQAAEIVKKYVDLPADYKMMNATFQDAKQGQGPFGRKSVWMLQFGKENRYENGSIQVVIDATTGTLVNLDFWQRDDSTLENSMTREEARAKALEYLKKMAPDKAEQVKEQDTQDKYYMYGPYGPRDVIQTFRFVRMVNGIPYSMDGISIRVNGKGELRGYNYQWSDDIQFPSVQPSITEEQAQKAFKDALNLQLFYQRIYKPYAYGSQEAQLVYGTWNRNYGFNPMPTIDAAKGTVIDRYGDPLAKVESLEFKPLTDKPGQTVTTTEISKERALELIASYKIDLAGYKLENTSYNNYNGQEHVWRFEYRQGDPQDYKTMKQVSIAIDAQTGELRELFRHEFREGPYEFPKNPSVSEEQAQQKAVEFIKTVLPAKTDKIALSNSMDSKLGMKSGPGYSFEFVRLEQGVPIRDNTFRVGIDPMTGQVREFGGAWYPNDKIKFQDKSNLMDLEAAKSKFLERYKLMLQYIPVYEKGKTPYEPGKTKGVVLVYAPIYSMPMQNLNAVTGEWVSDWGDMPQQVEIPDIKGHWAEKQLQYFVERGIFQVKDGKLAPDAAVTRGEMIKYLIMSISGPRIMQEKTTFNDVPKNDPNFEFIEEAAARKWIDRNTKNFRPNDVITREEMADIVTAILGYAKLSEAPDTFINHFKDVTDSSGKFTGDIAIVGALGIMTGAEGYFQPKSQVTKAQAAMVMTRVLDQMKERQGYPYYMTK
jgi:hypothetical protein